MPTNDDVLTWDDTLDSNQKWAAATGGSGIPETLLDAKGDLIVASAADTAARLPVGATDGHVLTVDAAETLGVKWAAGGSGGAVTTATSLPGSPSDGDTVLLRCGSTPFEFILMVYDATYGKWVSSHFLCNTKTSAGVTETSTGAYVGIATASQLRYPSSWKPLSTAGLVPQFRLIAQIQNSGGGNTTFCSLLCLTADAGASFATAGADFAAVSNVGTGANLRDSGWVAIPGGITVTDFITANIQVKVSAGTGTLFACSVQMRWVA